MRSRVQHIDCGNGFAKLTRSLSAVFFLYLSVAGQLYAQRQAQDNFWLARTWTNCPLGATSAGYGIAIDNSNRCYVVYGSGVVVYNGSGTPPPPTPTPTTLAPV
jgi:hypothetical protein